MNRRYLILAAIAGFVVTLDQMTKMYIHTQFNLGESYAIIQNFFDLTYVRNTGAAFGVFRDSQCNLSLYLLSIYSSHSDDSYSIHAQGGTRQGLHSNSGSFRDFWRSFGQLCGSPSFGLCCGLFVFSLEGILYLSSFQCRRFVNCHRSIFVIYSHEP